MRELETPDDREQVRAEQQRRLAAARAALEAATAPAGAERTPPPPPGREPSGRRSTARPAHPRQRPRRGADDGAPQSDGPVRDPHEVARAIVLRQLTMGPRSRSQLKEKLRQRDCAPDVAEAVLDRLEQVGLVNDRDFAQALVRSRQQHRGLARSALARDLRRAGVDQELAEAALCEVDSEDERARAVELASRRARTLAGLPRETQTRRLAGMLARKGYGTEMTLAVVRQVLDGLPEHRRD